METPEKGATVKSPDQTAEQVAKPGAQETGGGVTGFFKSLVGGTPVEESKTPDGQVVKHHEGDLKDGTVGTVKTTPGSSGSVPASLEAAGGHPSGSAHTELKTDTSPYAPALESIAGPADPAPDATEKFGPALDPIADAPATSSGYAAGVVSAVSAAAGTAVESIKHAAGYGQAEGVPDAPGQSHAEAVGAKPIAITVDDLPKLAVVEPSADGTAKIKAAESGTGEIITPTTKTATEPAAQPAVQPAAVPAAQPTAAATSDVAAEASKPSTQATPVEPSKTATGTPPTEAVRTNSTPAVSAFAAGQAQERGAKKPAEIKEDTPAAPVTGSKTGAKAGDAKDGDKAKANVCGCCVIS